MSEQTVSKSVHTIPQEIIEEIENLFSTQSRIEEHKHPIIKEVNEIEFIRTYQNKEGTWEEFKVNGVMLVSVLNGERWTWISVECDKERKKAFGKRVKYLMNEADVSWDLAKMAAKRYQINPIPGTNTADSYALDFLNGLKDELQYYINGWKDTMTIEEYLKTNTYYFFGHFTDKEIQIIKEYWLSLNT